MNLSIVFWVNKLLLIRTLSIDSVISNIEVVHTTHHHLAGMAESTTSTTTWWTHSKNLILTLDLGIDNACSSGWTYQATGSLRINAHILR